MFFFGENFDLSLDATGMDPFLTMLLTQMKKPLLAVGTFIFQGFFDKLNDLSVPQELHPSYFL